MYLVSIRLEPMTAPAHGAERLGEELRSLLSDAALPADRLEHVYVQPDGASPSVEAVLFFARRTLGEAEQSADAVLARCAVDGWRLSRRSTVPLATLVELSAYGADRG
ncbi:hypothetical protein [Streptomyces jumonjinensis]|nr:hypothetical protein [Streptomyces jumonjinensis]